MSTTRGTDCPTISLADVIRRIQHLPGEVQNRPTDKSLIASEMGFNRMHGTYYTVVAACIQYGLMEDVGVQLQVSAEARKILQPSEKNPEERMKAIRDAADAPPLFQELNLKWESLRGGELPDNDVLKEFFTRKGLSQSKIGDAVRAYRDTVRYVNEQTKGSDETLNAGVTKQSQTLKPTSTSAPEGSGLLSPPFLDEKGEIELSFRDSGGNEVRLKSNGPVSKILQDLIDFAQLQQKKHRAGGN